MNRMILLAAFLLTGCRGSAGKTHVFNGPEYTILTNAFSIETTVKSLYPDAQLLNAPDATKLENMIESLPDTLAQSNGIERSEDVAEIVTKLRAKQYNLQIIAFSLHSRPHLFINALNKSHNIPNWRATYQPVNDGGTDFWF